MLSEQIRMFILCATAISHSVLLAQQGTLSGTCGVTILPFSFFGQRMQSVQFALVDPKGRTYTNFSAGVPCGEYLLRVTWGFTKIERKVVVEEPDTPLFAGFQGYYGDYVESPVLSLTVIGVPKRMHAFARAFLAFGNYGDPNDTGYVREALIGANGKTSFHDLWPGFYIISVLADNRVLCTATTRFGYPTHVNRTFTVMCDRSKWSQPGIDSASIGRTSDGGR